MSVLLSIMDDISGQTRAFEAALAPHKTINILDGKDHSATFKEIRYAVVWKPQPGMLAQLPALEVIFSLGAGVDHILSDPDVPNVPIVRFVDPDLTGRMIEYVVLHALIHVRQQRRFDQAQKENTWLDYVPPAAHQFRLGIMGLGQLGTACLHALKPFGFQLSGWSRSPKQIEGVQTFSGEQERNSFLNQCDILVNLLPHTLDTDKMLNMDLFLKLAKDGPFGAPIIINAGRGKSQNQQDIITALEKGIVHGVSLDVFETEPLEAQSPLWGFDNAIITPHIAAVTNANALITHVQKQIMRHENNQPLQHIIDRNKGY